jgi:hypothetical protein
MNDGINAEKISLQEPTLSGPFSPGDADRREKFWNLGLPPLYRKGPLAV